MRRFKRFGLFIFAIVFIPLVMISLLQEKLIFLPTQLPQDYEYSFNREFDEFFLRSEDGAQLNALHFKAEKPKGLILYFHGNAGDLSRWGLITSKLVDFGYDVLVMDYRSYGKSTGRLSERTLYSDAEMFFEHALKSYDEEQIIVYGRSLGASIATNLTSKNQPHKLILETPFYNLEDVAKERFPLLPINQLLRYKMESNEFIQNVKIPIRIFHGTADRVVSYESGKRLYDAIPLSDKKLYTIEEGGHNNLDEFEAYWEALRSELK
ncbi:alpha/beta hydrolase [Flagellimonas allohymeniacidonis]|uniref:Alpha/beta fold hydrolase n=1 Tax=Flagellimonas allohymeniacidonis TaxID=2517819 RepID=A0A4Q8QEA3_9FLAO|nr:alpha/beta fold hydrolase [Allomuricauda hymeniacidonis]TAI48761.1 alpha/beta fold hydrolase [Allomuricauda hymeniacidonis]